MLQEFRGLVLATVELCIELGFNEIVTECAKAFESILSCNEIALDEEFNVDIERFKFVLGVIRDAKVEQKESNSTRSKIVEELLETVYKGEILGEETQLIRPELRPLYFGLKNVILKDIETIDKDIDIKKFFFEQ